MPLSSSRACGQPRARQGIAAAFALLVLGAPAHAEFKVRSPITDFREVELETNGDVTFDKAKSGLNNQQSYTHEVGFGPVPGWFVELEGEWNTVPGQNLQFTALTLENTFQFTPRGKYWADLGFFAEVSHAPLRGLADSVTAGPLIQKEWGDTIHTVNFLFSHDIGPRTTPATGFLLAWQSRYQITPQFQPGIEYYGAIDNLGAPGKFADQQHRLGPVLAGLVNFAPWGKLKYEVGYVFGVTRATETGAVRWRLEYEIPF
jgi:hypothetical protein